MSASDAGDGLELRFSFTALSIFNAGHGAGETIRGTINDTLDKFGDGLASDGTSNSDSSRLNKLQDSNHAPQDHANVVEKGKEEFQAGVNSMSNAGRGNGSSTAP